MTLTFDVAQAEQVLWLFKQQQVLACETSIWRAFAQRAWSYFPTRHVGVFGLSGLSGFGGLGGRFWVCWGLVDGDLCRFNQLCGVCWCLLNFLKQI